MKDVKEGYFRWMYDLVSDKQYFQGKSYTKLFRSLHSIEYYYIIPMDANRAEDAISLRYRFGYDKDVPDALIASEIDSAPPTVLEVMVALAFRMEEDIMGSSDFGNRIGKWFYMMIDNLGLSAMDNANPYYDDTYIFEKVNCWLERDFSPNGEGSLFFIEYPRDDLRTIDIWTQAMWYLTSTQM